MQRQKNNNTVQSEKSSFSADPDNNNDDGRSSAFIKSSIPYFRYIPSREIMQRMILKATMLPSSFVTFNQKNIQQWWKKIENYESYAACGKNERVLFNSIITYSYFKFNKKNK